jgi:hypothetical protein
MDSFAGPTLRCVGQGDKGLLCVRSRLHETPRCELLCYSMCFPIFALLSLALVR